MNSRPSEELMTMNESVESSTDPVVNGEKTLRQLLDAAISDYLVKDINFFHRDIKRAEDYRAELASVNDSKLAAKVAEDISMSLGQGSLGSSTKLRARLTLALSTYLGISDREIRQSANQNTYPMTAIYGHSIALVDFNLLQATYDLINERLSNQTEMSVDRSSVNRK